MYGLGLFCRYAASMVMYYVTPSPPECRLVEAWSRDDPDFTARLTTLLAEGSNVVASGYVCYSYSLAHSPGRVYYEYFGDGETVVFPPDWKSMPDPSPEDCVVMAEIEETGEDVTKVVENWAGPSGKGWVKSFAGSRIDVGYENTLVIYYSDGTEHRLKRGYDPKGRLFEMGKEDHPEAPDGYEEFLGVHRKGWTDLTPDERKKIVTIIYSRLY